MREAWNRVRRNGGAAGVDGQTIRQIANSDVDAWLDQTARTVRAGTYEPRPVLRRFISKDNGKVRPLGIPTVRDRVVQTAMVRTIGPLLYPMFRACSFAYIPRRNAAQAVRTVQRLVESGSVHFWDLDLTAFFDSLNRELLLARLRRVISEPQVLDLIEATLRAGVIHEDGSWGDTGMGTPQGAVLSPLLGNLYLHDLDVYWENEEPATRLVRYADDLVVLAQEPLTHVMGKLRSYLEDTLYLRVNERKTLLGHASHGFDFLGCRIRQAPARQSPGRLWCKVTPSERSKERLRTRVREIVQKRKHARLSEVISELNPMLRGWANYHLNWRANRTLRGLDWFVQETIRSRFGAAIGQHGLEGLYAMCG